MRDKNQTCGRCTHRKWKSGTCKSWCDKKGRLLTENEWQNGCKFYDDWKTKTSINMLSSQRKNGLTDAVNTHDDLHQLHASRCKKSMIIYQTDDYNGGNINAHERHILRQINAYLMKNVNKKSWQFITGEAFDIGSCEGFGYTKNGGDLVVPIGRRIGAISIKENDPVDYLTTHKIFQYQITETHIDDIDPPLQYCSKIESKMVKGHIFDEVKTFLKATDDDRKKYKLDVIKSLACRPGVITPR